MKVFSTILLLHASCLFLAITPVYKTSAQSAPYKPVRVAVAGITHGHAGFILGRNPKPDIELVGIY